MKCFFCSSQAHYKCCCSIIYLCEYDLENHLNCPGIHKPEILDINLSEKKTIKLQKTVRDRIQALKLYKKQVILKTSSLINTLETWNNSLAKQIDSYIFKYYSFFNRDKVSKSEVPEIEKILKTTLEIKQFNISFDEIIESAYKFEVLKERVPVKLEIKQLATMNLQDFNRFYIDQADKYKIVAVRRSVNGTYAFICKRYF